MYRQFVKKKDLLDARFVFTLIFTLPALASMVNGMILFFMGMDLFYVILFSALLGLLLGGMMGLLFNFITISIGAINSLYFGIMGPMIATPIISSNLCGFSALGNTYINIISLTALGFILVCVLSLLYTYLYKI